MINYTLNSEEEEIVKWGMHHAPKAEVRQRATAIYLLHQSHSPSAVSEMLAVERSEYL